MSTWAHLAIWTAFVEGSLALVLTISPHLRPGGGRLAGALRRLLCSTSRCRSSRGFPGLSESEWEGGSGSLAFLQVKPWCSYRGSWLTKQLTTMPVGARASSRPSTELSEGRPITWDAIAVQTLAVYDPGRQPTATEMLARPDAEAELG